ncbi:MAG: hypothetical protein ACOZBH_01040 [Patescibacteria group bacterium]
MASPFWHQLGWIVITLGVMMAVVGINFLKRKFGKKMFGQKNRRTS